MIFQLLSSLEGALENIKTLIRVGAYGTWLFCPSQCWVIEFYHHGDITIGLENPTHLIISKDTNGGARAKWVSTSG